VSSRLSKPARRIVKLLLFALVVHLFVIPQIGGARKALDVLSSVDPLLLVAAVLLEAVSFLAYARMTQLLLPAENRPGLGVTFGAVMASTGINHVVPGGAATTAAVNYRLLGRAGVPADELGFALGTQAIGSAVVLNMLLWLALIASIPATGFQPVYATAAAVGAVLIAVFAAAVISMLRGREVLANRVADVLGRLPRLQTDSVRAVMLGLADQLQELSRDRSRLRIVVGMAAANWLLDAAALWVVLAAFGSRPSPVGLMVAYGLANVMAAVPISPGGLGVIEAILIPTLIGFGTPRAEASIGVVVYRLVNFWMPIPVGAASYVAVERITASPASEPDVDGFVAEINRRVPDQA
jgi:uncharacterized protein (TIRG00374 family)